MTETGNYHAGIPVCILLLWAIVSCSPGERLDLSTGWRIFPGDNPACKNADFNDSGLKQIDLPGRLSDAKEHVFWLRKRFVLPESFRNRDIALYMGKIRDADRTFMNGVTIGVTGMESPKFTPAWQYERYYFIPSNVLRHGKENLIAVRIYTETMPLFNGRPFISGAEEARIYNFSQRFKSEFIVIGLTILTLFIGMFSLVQFLSYRKYWTPLCYTIVTCIMCVISVHYYIPSIPFIEYRTSENIFFALLSVVMTMNYLLVENLLNMKSRLFRIYIVTAMAVSVAVSLTATGRDPVHGWRMNVIVALGFVSNLLWAATIAGSLRKKFTAEAGIITAGFAVYLFCVIADSLAATGTVILGMFLLPVGFHVIIVTIGIVLSLRTSGIMRGEELKKFLPPQLVDSILKGKHEVKYENERKKITIFFSDIRGFTDTTDAMEAEELSGLLNEYLTEMTMIADRHGGTIDKFIGDAIMIFFGAPEKADDRESALRCVAMAIDMQRRMKVLGKKWFDEGIETPFQIRIGINTGTATVGNFGAEVRLSYTAIGGQVNLAARLQGLSEPGGILISHTTYALVKDRIPCRSMGKVKVKGIHRGVLTYNVILD